MMIRKHILRNGLLVVLVLLVGGAWTMIHPTRAQVPGDALSISDRVNTYLAEANIDQGARELAIELSSNPDDDNLRFATGFLQFADAVENLGQSWYEYGLLSQGPLGQVFPFLRLPVPQNPDPVRVTNRQSRQALDQFVTDVLSAEQTLAEITSKAVKLEVYLGRAYFDFDADGQGAPPESLWRIYAALNRQAQVTEEQADTFLISFDAGDVDWLRGYCHFLAAVLDFYLAHDDSVLFNHVAHIFFQSPETPYDFLSLQTDEEVSRYVFLDAIALAHLINLPVIDSRRTEAALAHLQQMIGLSRRSWNLYRQETDNDHEWIPYPGQTGVIPGVQVTLQMIDQWFAFLDEAEAILAGELLLPFWRGSQPVGINLNRVFAEPQTFDAVLWGQGTAANPYLETGDITDPDFWRRLIEAFNGRFLFFAFWFN